MENAGQGPRWLEWAREIQALAQTGAHYSTTPADVYHHLRYERLTEIAAEIINQHSNLGYQPLMELFASQNGYATPKVDVRAAVFKDGKLLLVQEASDSGWTMPGGWADVGDTPAHAAEREAWEEAGFHVRAAKLIGVYDANRVQPLELFHAFKLVFLCEIISGEATPSIETSAVAFFGLDEMPANLSGERTLPRHIRDAFAALTNPHLPTVFD